MKDVRWYEVIGLVAVGAIVVIYATFTPVLNGRSLFDLFMKR